MNWAKAIGVLLAINIAASLVWAALAFVLHIPNETACFISAVIGLFTGFFSGIWAIEKYDLF